MLDFWPLLLGWPAIACALAFSIAGILRQKSVLLYIAALIVLPFSAYIAATPRFQWVGLLFPVLIVATGVAVKRRHTVYAWILLAPCLIFIGWLAIVVTGQ